MEIRPLEFAIVVVASDCNPTILNKDFLKYQNIVPEEWGWKVTSPEITTPPFASVSYDSGVSVTVEPNKFQVVDHLSGHTPDASKIPEIARRYIEVLPHVRYTAVGHNFKAMFVQSDAEIFLKDRFLKTGPWDSEDLPLQSVGLKFAYLLEDGRLNVSLDAASMIDQSGHEPKEISGILFHANYHRDCQDYPSFEQVIDHLKDSESDWRNFQSIASRTLG